MAGSGVDMALGGIGVAGNQGFCLTLTHLPNPANGADRIKSSHFRTRLFAAAHLNPYVAREGTIMSYRSIKELVIDVYNSEGAMPSYEKLTAWFGNTSRIVSGRKPITLGTNL